MRGITSFAGVSCSLSGSGLELSKPGLLRGSALASLFCLLCFAGSSTAAHPGVPQRSASRGLAANLNSHFAIADFDGDQQADFATVQAAVFNSLQSRYWIRFQLSGGARQSFGITAQPGGLELAARDVNGDHALDVIVSTTWLNQTVAILINDGRGNFTLVNPSAFPGIVADSTVDSSQEPVQTEADMAELPPRTFLAKCTSVSDFNVPKGASSRYYPAASPMALCVLHTPLHERAPPGSIHSA